MACRFLAIAGGGIESVAHFFPTYLTIHGWMPAIWGGLLMLFAGIVTSNFSKLMVKNNFA